MKRRVAVRRQGSNACRWRALTASLMRYTARMLMKTFQYRLYPTKEQRRLLERQLEECRWLSLAMERAAG
jgi:hypothetical protein